MTCPHGWDGVCGERGWTCPECAADLRARIEELRKIATENRDQTISADAEVERLTAENARLAASEKVWQECAGERGKEAERLLDMLARLVRAAEGQAVVSGHESLWLKCARKVARELLEEVSR